MAERADEGLRKKARRLGVSILAFKPGLSKLDPLQYEADLRAFGDKLARDLVPRLLERGRGPRPPPRAAPAPVAPADEAARAAALRAHSTSSQGQPDPDLVAFLLLRAARAFFPRVVLFLVKDDQLRGLSGFGPTGRRRRASTSSPGSSRSPWTSRRPSSRRWPPVSPGPAPRRPTARRGDLLARLGPLGVASAAVLPVRAQQETIAVLYGDDPEGGPLPALEPLVDFADAGRDAPSTRPSSPAGRRRSRLIKVAC